MLALVNTNRMRPAIGPIGLDYVAGAAKSAGFGVELVDFCLSDDPTEELSRYFAGRQPRLVGVSLRNVDDSFWPSGRWFVPEVVETVRQIKALTDAPVVIGGVGFSILAEQVLEQSGADFGIRGDGEEAVVSLMSAVGGQIGFEQVPGLLWRLDGRLRCNPPAWPAKLQLKVRRDTVDNKSYFRLGGQCGVETKRGCDRRCIYCADPLAKGPRVRAREAKEVADEVELLAGQGIDVLHICDAEFNVPRSHALAVCEELGRRKLGERVRWYAYMTVSGFDKELAGAMKRAGCVGIDFGADAGCDAMLRRYRRDYDKADLANAVRLCKANGITVMLDLLLGGPGETRETAAETIDFVKEIGPDCAGAALGVRVYPGTAMCGMVEAKPDVNKNPNLRRKYEGDVDFARPTFYISSSLGDRPAEMICDLIGGDERFFPPTPEQTEQGSRDHNYNDNTRLVKAIEAGARGAYWDILRKLGSGG